MPLFPVPRLPGFLACLLSAMLVACGGGGTSPSTEIAFLPIEGNFNGNWPVNSYVARTDSEWSQIWDLQGPKLSPPPPRPVVDFAAYTIVGASLGGGPTGCYSMDIPRITDEADQIRVEFRQVVALPPIACSQGGVSLVIFVKIPATTKPIVFQQVG
jgi:hypothetical protein